MANEPIKLDLTVHNQEEDLWCFAAVARSVARHYALERAGGNATVNVPSQCSIVSDTILVGIRKRNPDATLPAEYDCCNNHDSCYGDHYLKYALEATKISQRSYATPISWEQVVSKISENKVICALIEWGNQSNQGPAHYVLIYGYWEKADGTKKVYIGDTLAEQNNQWVEWNDFHENYECNTIGEGGKWKETFYTYGQTQGG